MEEKHKLAVIKINGTKYLVQVDLRPSNPGDEIAFEIDGNFFTTEYFISKEDK